MAVVGDGWIGMEVAASARSMGLDVTVVGRSVHPSAVCSGRSSARCTGRSTRTTGAPAPQRPGRRDHGERGRVSGVDMHDGTHVEADVVVVGVGVTPNVGFAEAAGITLRDRSLGGGLAVDATLRTSAPTCGPPGTSRASLAALRAPLRVEHWSVALETGPHVARAMLGSREPYDKLPYFFSDQYDVGMEYLGFVEDPAETEVVVSGSLESNELVAFWVAGDRVQAGMAVNTWEQMERVEELVGRRARSAGTPWRRSAADRTRRPCYGTSRWACPRTGSAVG
ncbi:FAD/NAD(P)-binding oxidoreductase [Oerskovia sp. M15]